MGIIGYTHGVRLVSNPPTNRSGSAVSGLEPSASERPEKSIEEAGGRKQETGDEAKRSIS
jgi:hypothetical protein